MTPSGRYGTYGTHLALFASCIYIYLRVVSRNSTEFWRCSGHLSLSFFSPLRERGSDRATLKLCGARQLKRVTGGSLFAFRLLAVVDRILPLLCPPAIHIGRGTLLLARNVYRDKREGDFYTVFVRLLSET